MVFWPPSNDFKTPCMEGIGRYFWALGVGFGASGGALLESFLGFLGALEIAAIRAELLRKSLLGAIFVLIIMCKTAGKNTMHGGHLGVKMWML